MQYPQTFSIYGLQPRERCGGKPHNKFTEMCHDYASEIGAALPATLVVLYGYSFGVVIAYELQQHRPPPPDQIGENDGQTHLTNHTQPPQLKADP